jgi:hypothetical protein
VQPWRFDRQTVTATNICNFACCNDWMGISRDPSWVCTGLQQFPRGYCKVVGCREGLCKAVMGGRAIAPVDLRYARYTYMREYRQPLRIWIFMPLVDRSNNAERLPLTDPSEFHGAKNERTAGGIRWWAANCAAGRPT